MTSVADAEAVACEWINSRSGTLVGPTHPLAKGALLNRMEGHPPAPYAYVSAPTPATRAFGVESPAMRAPVSFQVYAASKQGACDGAMALVEEMITELDGVAKLITLPRGEQVWILVADEIEGPSWQPDLRSPRYVVTADLYLQPE